MKFNINREVLLPALQHIVAVIEKRQTMPILANVLLSLSQERLGLTGTDLEIQLVARLPVETIQPGSIAVPARKLLDLCRLLPPKADLVFEQHKEKIKLVSHKSRFMLNCLPADAYPDFAETKMEKTFSISAETMLNALAKTLFCMANQDVRYYLNGLLIHISNSKLKLVASDGHRLSIFETNLENPTGYEEKLILPRKGALELYRLLNNLNSAITIHFSNNNIKVKLDQLTFSAKLVDAKYPDFSKVFQQGFFQPISIPKQEFKDSLTRAAVLANEKFKAVTLDFTENLLKITTQNPEHDEAEEEVSIAYSSDPLTISFNAQYLLDAVSYIEGDDLILTISSNSSCCFVEEAKPSDYKFIVMPMRL